VIAGGVLKVQDISWRQVAWTEAGDAEGVNPMRVPWQRSGLNRATGRR